MPLARARTLAVSNLLTAALALACGSGSSTTPGGGGGTGGGGGGSGGGGGGESCLGSTLLSSLGKSRVLVGLSGSDTAAIAAPYDLRYIYLAGAIEDPGVPCADWNWWACWGQGQGTQPNAGLLHDLIDQEKGRNAVPMFTYYLVLQASGVGEGAPEVNSAITNTAFMTRYLRDWRYLLQQIGSDVALLHVEPDFWGYGQQVAAGKKVDATGLPAKVKSANSTDCADQPDTLAGLGRCMIAMVRKYAPHAKVGLHASMWGSGWNVTESFFDPVTEAGKTAAFLKSAGADAGDFIVADLSDRDAQFYQLNGNPNTWYDTNNVKLPNFHEAFTWSKALAEGLGVPLVWWQIPVGNASGNGTKNHYQDNRVDYLLTHADEVAASHGVALAFGAGEGQQTDPDTDGGNLAAKTTAYVNGGGAAVCR